MELTKEQLTKAEKVVTLGENSGRVYKQDLKPFELAGKHIDGKSGLVFDTEEEYVAYVNGEIEKDPAYYGENYQAVSQAALERGESRKTEDGSEGVSE